MASPLSDRIQRRGQQRDRQKNNIFNKQNNNFARA